MNFAVNAYFRFRTRFRSRQFSFVRPKHDVRRSIMPQNTQKFSPTVSSRHISHNFVCHVTAEKKKEDKSLSQACALTATLPCARRLVRRLSFRQPVGNRIDLLTISLEEQPSLFVREGSFDPSSIGPLTSELRFLSHCLKVMPNTLIHRWGFWGCVNACKRVGATHSVDAVLYLL